MRAEDFAGTAFSYIRFSYREQEQGDSIRRQRQLRDDWLALNPRVALDTTLGGEDRGVSAFRGKNQGDRHHLGRFLEAVRRGRVSHGSILLLESLDRLSRQEEEEALALLLSLLNAGVVIVQLEPYTVFRKGDGMMGLMRALLYLSRAREESATKSARVSRAWRNLQKQAAERKAVITARCPAWLEVADGRFRFKPGAQAVLRRIFEASVGGRGARMIAHDLSAEKVPHFDGGTWQGTYITAILGNRAVVGEYQAMHRVNGKRVPNGPAVENYFPASIPERLFLAARRAIKARKHKGGRRGDGGWVALFSNVYDARTGERLQAILRIQGGRRYHVLQPSGVLRWGTKCVAFPLSSFEPAVRRLLDELDLSEILPPAEGGDRVVELSDRLAVLETRITNLQAALVGGVASEAELPVLRELDRQRQATAAELAAEQQEVASPIHEQWGTLRGLDAAIETDPDTRLRVRQILGRLIERIDCVIVPGAACRALVAQVRFHGSDAVRDYLVVHYNARRGKDGGTVEAKWEARSFAGPLAPGQLDLRKAEHVRMVEEYLPTLLGLGEPPAAPGTGRRSRETAKGKRKGRG